MGALPWTLRTMDKPAPFKVISSESSPLPKSSLKQQEELPRRGSLNVTVEETL
jgi:hypothetical protein